MNKSIFFYNLGCKVNQYELDVIREEFLSKGYNESDTLDNADIVIVNTCTVTNIADHKSRQIINKVRTNNSDAIICAIGCFVQLLSEEEIEKLKEENKINIFIGNNDKKNTFQIIDDYINDFDISYNHVGIIDNASYDNLVISNKETHTRAYIKIEDGCNEFCSYCAICYARGRVRSKTKEQVLQEINGLIKNGYKEIVLTGIHLTSYGKDLDYSLKDLLVFINENINTEVRLRIGSLEPRIITKDFLETISKMDNICPHFHLVLQSGLDKTLKNMNRKYTTSEYKKSVDLIRNYYKNPAITTDIIAGFPGETDEDFNQSYDYIDSINYFMTHIFPFSKRKGTRAYSMQGQVTNKIKNDRCTRLNKLNKS